MLFSTSLIVAALLSLGAATTHNATKSDISALETLRASAAAVSPQSSPAPGGQTKTHVIQVGGSNGSLVFLPDNVKAAAGDLVQFQFRPKNHSVAQSTFDQPCVPIQNVMTNMTNAFFSGFMPTTAPVGATTQVLTYTIRVTDTKPIWFYCAQGRHCQSGMVGAINAAETGNKTLEAFKSLAKQAPENIAPGGTSGSTSTPPASSGVEETTTPTATGASGATTTSAAPAQQSVNAAATLHDASKQSLLSLAFGGVAALLLL